MTNGALSRTEEILEQKVGDFEYGAGTSPQCEVSVVIPVFNESDSLEPLYQNIVDVFQQAGESWEIIFVDDGSVDDSLSVLKVISARDSRVRVIQLRRNFGQTAALCAGFDHAQGRVVITMDGDLQNDPADIPRLLAKLDEGYDIVSGWRKHRKDPMFTKGIPSTVSNRLASRLTGVNLHDFGCTLKAYRREVVKNIHLYGELHRYIPAVASFIGVNVAEIDVMHHPRKYGTSKYGITRLLRGTLDLVSLKLMLTYMTRPMQMFGGLGALMVFLGFLSGTASLLMKVLMGRDITGNPLLYVMMLCFIIGLQFISLGFLGEMVLRIYYEAQHKPIYMIRKTFGVDGRDTRPLDH